MMLAVAMAALLQELPSKVDIEMALQAHFVRVYTYPEQCRSGRRVPGCLVPPKRIKVRDFDCSATGKDAKGGDILYCRVTYAHSGGSLAFVTSPNECVPLRSYEIDGLEHGTIITQWEVALVDHKGKCPGARE